MSNAGSEQPWPKWRTIFMELAVRAIRQVHLDSQSASLGVEIKVSSPDELRTAATKINQSAGIHFAREPAVVAAIAHEFNASRAAWGWVVLDDARRHFRIDHEEQYEKNARKHCDLTVRRVGIPKGEFGIVYVEVKRARLWNIDFERGTVKPGSSQEGEVAKDVGKLVELLSSAASSEEEKDRRYGHVLVWGDTAQDGSPEAFFESVNKQTEHTKGASARITDVRWLPMVWPAYAGNSEPKEVSSWLWIALAEIVTPS